jgi:hypothetical protein
MEELQQLTHNMFYKLRKEGFDFSHIQMDNIGPLCKLQSLSDANGWYPEQYKDWLQLQFQPRPPTPRWAQEAQIGLVPGSL